MVNTESPLLTAAKKGHTIRFKRFGILSFLWYAYLSLEWVEDQAYLPLFLEVLSRCSWKHVLLSFSESERHAIIQLVERL